MKYISKLQYITDNPLKIENACLGGADWIQLRVKNKSPEEWMAIGSEAFKICKKYGAKLIVNDNVLLAKEIGADGVHLGKGDMSVVLARKTLGEGFVVGGTANTLEDMKNLISLNIDYIGLGPYRFTQTKEQLSPILGLEGYRRLMRLYEIEKLNTPVVAIGGIKMEDVNPILKTGVYGIALSSAISEAKDISESTRSFIKEINSHDKNKREYASDSR